MIKQDIYRKSPFFCRTMLCINAAYAVMRCLCVCLSVMFVDHVKTNKHIFKIFSQSGSPTILVFPYQTGWRYSHGNPPNGGVECRWGRQKTRSWMNTCIQVYSVVNRTSREVWKTKPRRASSTPRRPSSVVHTRRRRSVCDGLDVIRRRRREVNPPPLVITPVFSCCRTS